MEIREVEDIKFYIALSDEEQKYYLKNQKSVKLNLLWGAHELSKKVKYISSIKIHEAVVALKEKDNLRLIMDLLLDDIKKLNLNSRLRIPAMMGFLPLRLILNQS